MPLLVSGSGCSRFWPACILRQTESWGSKREAFVLRRLETGWEQRFASFTVTPFAAVQFSELWQPGFAETTTAVATPGQLGLSYQSKTTPSLPTFVGVQLDTRVTFANGMAWSPLARLSWVHEFEPVRDLTATLSTLPLATFGIEGARAARDSARIDLGSKLAISRNAWLFASVVGEFSDISQAYAGKGGVRFTW